MSNHINSNYKTILKATGNVDKITINGVTYTPNKDKTIVVDATFLEPEDLSPVAFTGNYDDLLGLPTLFSGDYNDLDNLPSLFSGNYNDLTNKPALFSGNYNDLSDKPNLSALATAIQSASNVGTGTAIYSDRLGTALRFRTIKAGDNVTISTATDGTITIASAGGDTSPAGETNTSSTLGAGVTLVAPKNGTDLPFRSLLSSAGLTWSQQANTVTLSLHSLLQAYIEGAGFGLGTVGRVINDGNELVWSGLGRATTLNKPNLPTAGVGYGIGMPHDDNMLSLGGQLFLNYSSDDGNYVLAPRLFARSKTSGTSFGNWIEFWNSYNLPISNFAKTLLDDNDAGVARATLGLGTAATANAQNGYTDSTAGALLRVGAFGLGGNAVVISDPDIVYRPSGLYDVAPDVSWANRPITGWTRILHLNHANITGYATQIATGNWAAQHNRYFQRTCIAGGWSGWVELFHTGNFDPASKLDVNPSRLLIIGNPGYPDYSSGQLELRSTDGKDVSIGFHRGGYTACQLRHSSDGLMLSGTGRTSAATFYSYGSIQGASDSRLKENIKTISNALDKVNKLRGVNFTWSSNDKQDMGVIAQEVLDVVPEVVEENADGYYGVSYGNLVGLLIEAIKEQDKKISKLEERLNGSSN